jgi:hypothetical protein
VVQRRKKVKKGSPGVEDAKRVGRRLDWVPTDAESAALGRMGEAEVEKRALARFTLFAALRERRVTPREVSIMLDNDDNNKDDDDGENMWMCVGERTHSEQCVVFNIQTQIQLRQHPAQPDWQGRGERLCWSMMIGHFNKTGTSLPAL